MINPAKLATFLSAYKAQFVANWPNERFKWQAIKHFQDNWNIDAPDFGAMFEKATAKTQNLLTSQNYLPKNMIIKFARIDETTTREMFRLLYTESFPLNERVKNFRATSEELVKRYDENKSSYQKENSISTYLWLKYPATYYIYKYSEFVATALAIDASYVPKKGEHTDLIGGFQMYDEIRQYLLADTELQQLLNSQRTDDCYSDQTLHTLTVDFGYYITQQSRSEPYSPGLSVDDWSELLHDQSLFGESQLIVMKRFLDIGGAASISALANKYGGSAHFHSMTSTYLAKKIISVSGGQSPGSEKDAKFWPVLYTGWHEDSHFVWKLRPELHTALQQMDLSLIPLYESDKTVTQTKELYTHNNFLSEVFFTPEHLTTCIALLKRKHNLILQGAPGVGKTYAAERLAFAMMGVKDTNRIHKIQFHQNYSYEDFVQGYRPDGNGFSLKNGSFYDFCQRAANDPEQDYFFIIDEINRGNISKIFGELLMLIESDYRGKEVTLAYGEQPFSVPSKLYIIGMMNTADRSLAMIDYALRRRFSFVELTPGFDSDGFRIYQQSLNDPAFDALVTQLKALNKAISDDLTLGSGFCIGHSYLCGLQKDALNLSHIVDYDIIPMLKEYWFDEQEKVDFWSVKLRTAVYVQ